MEQPTDTPAALTVLAEFDYAKPKLAAQLGVSLRTVQRWAAGRHTPAKRNLTNLRALVGQLLMFESANQDSARQRARMRRLEVATEALLTEAERIRIAELEQRARTPQVSITSDADPFDLCRDRHSAEADLVDAALGRRTSGRAA